MSYRKLVLAAALLAPSLASAEDLKTERREVSSFNAIEMRGAAKIDITVGSAQSIVLEARPKVLSELTTEVRSGTLIIDRKNHEWLNWKDYGPVRIHITVPKLASYALQGTAETEIKGLTGSTDIALNGTGSVKGWGNLAELDLSLNGTGSADFTEAPADAVKVSVNGTGSALVHSRHSITARLNGVGSVTYSGSPEHVETSIQGIGSIHHDS